MLKLIVAVIAGLLAFAFWGFGAYDMWATLSGYEPYLADLREHGGGPVIDWAQGLPLWRQGLWVATNVAGLAGALLLVFRAPIAPIVMWLTIAVFVAGFAIDMTMLGAAEAFGQRGIIFMAVSAPFLAVIALIASWAVRRPSPA